jgi:hypothetical protein
MSRVGRYGQVGHLDLSASELLSGGASNAWPLRYAVFLYLPPSFVIFVVHPVFHVITAALPSSFQVPVIPSPLVAFATPPLDNVISKGRPAVSLTFHTPSNALAARLVRLVIPIKQAAVTAALIVFLIIVTPPSREPRQPNNGVGNVTTCGMLLRHLGVKSTTRLANAWFFKAEE